MNLKAFIPLLLAAAVAMGFALPRPHQDGAHAQSQLQLLEIQPG